MYNLLFSVEHCTKQFICVFSFIYHTFMREVLLSSPFDKLLKSLLFKSLLYFYLCSCFLHLVCEPLARHLTFSLHVRIIWL